MKKTFIFIIPFIISFFGFGQNLPNDCTNYIQACDNQNIAYDVSGFGIQEIVPPSCSSQENNSLWIRVTVDSWGTLGFDLVPLSPAIEEDYDFWVFGPNVTCDILGAPIRCSTTNPEAINQANNHTGMNAASSDLFEGPGNDGNSFVRNLPVQAGQSYFIVIDRPVGSSPFTLTWTGTATIANPFQAYNFQDFPTVNLCDSGNDGIENFDFSTLSAAYLAGTNGEFMVTYFSTSQDAIFNSNPLVGPVQVNSGTYYARVSNILTVCFEVKTIPIVLGGIEVNDVSKIICENNINQEAIVDLGTFSNEIYTGNDSVSFSYFPTLADAEGITNELTNVQSIPLPIGVHTFFVRVVSGDCFAIAELTIEVVGSPLLNSAISLKQCDDNLDGFSAFNLTEANPLLVSSTNGLVFDYFTSLADAQNNLNSILNPTNFVNQNTGFGEVYVRVTNLNNCSSIVSLALTVTTTLIPAGYLEVFTACDDMASGSQTDGIATFDFSSFTITILNLFPQGQQLTVTYFESIADALAEQNPILDTANFVNSNSPDSQDIYVRIDSQLNNACIGLGHHIMLKVEQIPIVNPFEIVTCDDDDDGLFSFDTTNLENNFLNGLTNVTIEYRDQNNVVLPSPLPNPFVSDTKTLLVTIKNNTPLACSFQTTLSFVVDYLPKAFDLPTSLIQVCDDETDPLLQNGIYSFDTSLFQSTILGGQTGMIVEYYDENNLPLSSPLPNPYVSSSQIITAKVFNPTNLNCFAIVQIPFTVLPTPMILLESDIQHVCKNNPDYFVELTAGLENENSTDNYSYQWFLNQTLITDAVSYSILVNQAGTYTVEVTSFDGCIKTRTIQVMDSEIAVIEDIIVNDLIDENSIVIVVSGIGNYVYSIDGVVFQESTIFTNIEPGLITIYVKDLYNCGIETENINVLSIPKFFTPNSDGYNDLWNLRGITQDSNIKVKIDIFDRYGKLLFQITPINQGWNGTINGNPLPADDYWYVISLDDNRTIKGHFSLKR
ncbi:MAG TPA: T9SS type B sorting domain-containing protein [Flavobacterium sp.]|nr:T9SS type B sorting domain-containing protein [Flavobacterium sp.]